MDEERPNEEINEETPSAEATLSPEEELITDPEVMAQTGEEKTEALAIVALIFGILSICGSCCGIFGSLFPLIAIICGFLAKSKISKEPGLKGDGIALAGIIMGFVAIGLIVVSVIFGAASIIMDNVK